LRLRDWTKGCADEQRERAAVKTKMEKPMAVFLMMFFSSLFFFFW